MVCRWGMSELGPITFTRAGPRFAGIPELGQKDDRECSEATSRAIDDQIAGSVALELARAREVLRARREALETVAKELLAKETLERGELLALVTARPSPSRCPPSSPCTLPSPPPP
jgi:cell division protease FtsH